MGPGRVHLSSSAVSWRRRLKSPWVCRCTSSSSSSSPSPPSLLQSRSPHSLEEEVGEELEEEMGWRVEVRAPVLGHGRQVAGGAGGHRAPADQPPDLGKGICGLKLLIGIGIFPLYSSTP